METTIDHDALDTALRRCGASWDAAQTHGLLSGRLAIAGGDSGFEWLAQVLEGTEPNDALRSECEVMLSQLFETTYRQLAERQSEFEPLLPGDEDSAAVRAAARCSPLSLSLLVWPPATSGRARDLGWTTDFRHWDHSVAVPTGPYLGAGERLMASLGGMITVW